MQMRRRAFTAAMASALLMGCARPGQGHEVVKDRYWSAFRKRFLDGSGRIVDTGNQGISHSEGQGYGLLLAEMAGDRASFEHMLEWTRATLMRHDLALFSWKYVPQGPVHVPDRNNATDGDMLIAWSLERAASRWGRSDWADLSRTIRSAIHDSLIVRRGKLDLLLPAKDGFVHDDRIVVNPSYLIWPALDAFLRADGDGVWGKVISDSELLLHKARFGAHALPSDWIEVYQNEMVAPAQGYPARFGYDAVRVPLYALTGGRPQLAEPAAAYWRGKIAAGQTPPAWIDVNTGEEAPYALSPGGLTIASRCLARPAPASPLTGDYYASVLQALAGTL